MASTLMNHAESFDKDKVGCMFSPVGTTTKPSTSHRRKGRYLNIAIQPGACPALSLTSEAETNLLTSQGELVGLGRDSFPGFMSRDSNAPRPAWPQSRASIVRTEDMGGSIPTQRQLQKWQRTPQMFLGYLNHRVDVTRSSCDTRWSPISIPSQTGAGRHQNRGLGLSNEPTLATEILGWQSTSGSTTSGGHHSPSTSFKTLSDADELEAALHQPLQSNNRQRQAPRSRGRRDSWGWRGAKQNEDGVLGRAGGRREPLIQLTEEEKMATLYVLDRVQRDSMNDTSATVDCALFTTQDWLERVCTPVVRELELSVTYRASGLDARARLGRVESVPSLRRWVAEHWSAEKARRKYGDGIPAELRRRAFRASAVARKNKAESQFPRTLGTRLAETIISDASSTTDDSRRASRISSYRSLVDDADESADTFRGDLKTGFTSGAGLSVDHRFLWSPVDSSVAAGLDLPRGDGPACSFPRVGGGSQLPIIRRSLTCGGYDKECGNVDTSHTSGSSTTPELTSETEENEEGGEKRAVSEEVEIEVEEVLNAAEDTTHDCEPNGTCAVDRSVDRLLAKGGADASDRGPKETFGMSPINYRARFSTTWVIPKRTSRPAFVRPKSKPLTTVLTPHAGRCSSASTLPPSITVATVRVGTSAATTVTGGLTTAAEESPGKACANRTTRTRGTTKRDAHAEGASRRPRVVGQDAMNTQHSHRINDGNWGAYFTDSSGSSTGVITSDSRDLHKRNATRRSVDDHSSASSTEWDMYVVIDPAGDAICDDLGAVVSGVGDEVCLGDKGSSDDGLLHLHECIWKSGRLMRRPDTSPAMLRIQRDKRGRTRANQ